MARNTSTQRGASRRNASSTARSGSSRGGAAKRAPSKKKASGTAASRAARRPAGPWVPVLIVGLVLVLGWSLYPAMKLQYQASRRMAGLEQQYTSLKQRNQALRAQVAELKTPAGVERAARENLGYAKKGDNVYVVVPSGASTGSTGATQTTSAVAAPERGVVQTILDALFGVEQPSTVVEP
jgi:cell division protein FtsL